MNGLDRIIDGIIEDAKMESGKITAGARAEAGDIIRSAQEMAKKVIEDAKILADAEYNRIVKSAKSTAEVTEKRLLLREKQEIIEGVIKAAREKISALDDESYFKLMERLLDKCATGDAGELVLSERDKSRIKSSLIKAAKSKGLTISDKARNIDSGFVLVYGDIEENCSIETVMEAEKEKLYDAVNSFLF